MREISKMPLDWACKFIFTRKLSTNKANFICTSMVESVGGLRGGGLPCGGCQRFESAYLQL
ncbi:hypothetical protein Goari_006739, partial [Gossypium aridum]|nr:hypothetical protein [Gossypium aridum]